MLYGPNGGDVHDILEFLDQRQLLRRPDVLDDLTVSLLGTLDNVEDYRHLPEDVDPDCDVLVWLDIKRTAGTGDSTISRRASRALGPDLRQRLSDLWRSRVHPVVTQQLLGIVSNHHAEDIANDFEMMIDFRAAFGRNVPFIERLLKLYKAGGYPCGWDGIYPGGQIAVYHPAAPRSHT